jgi:hypothetical protein
MLYVITPVSRPNNLLKIAASVPEEVKWCIVYDVGINENPFIDEEYADYIYRADKKSSWGHTCRNYALDHLPLQDGDWLYYLDDDNIFHPELLNIKLENEYSFIAMLQSYQGKVRFPTVEIKKGRLDMGACLYNWKWCKDERWTAEYEQDFNYTSRCLQHAPAKSLPIVASYYNALRWE